VQKTKDGFLHRYRGFIGPDNATGDETGTNR